MAHDNTNRPNVSLVESAKARINVRQHGAAIILVTIGIKRLDHYIHII